MRSRTTDLESRRRAAALEEVVLPLPAERDTITPVTEFRSTWIVSSIAGLRVAGHYDRYLAALPDHRHAILSSVAGSWLPMEVVRSHYLACQSLGLTEDQILKMAGGEGGSVRRTWHANVIGAAKREDATPWSILPTLHKLWLRGANGGAAAVYRSGERQARVEYVACELFNIPYFRHAVRAVLVIFLGHTCEQLEVVTLAQAQPGEVSFSLRWTDSPVE